MKRTVSVIFGTRPEAIKLCPLVLALREHAALRVDVCVTAQHRHMLDQVLDVFGVAPDTDLNLMQRGQSLGGFAARALSALDGYLERCRPELVIVQGDTTTVLAATLAAFYRHIPIGHVEAGLRTGNMESPWPEEANRVLTSRLAALHFAPTEANRQNLLREGVDAGKVFVTGNTVIDALMMALERVHARPPEVPGLPPRWDERWWSRPLVLITGHRRESFGAGFEGICRAVAVLAERHHDKEFVYPVHLNPNVREPAHRILGGEGRDNVHLIDPLAYLPFVALMERACLILTDSGGVQEEAPTLHKPVLVMRDTTERPEAVQAGAVRVVGTDPARIVAEAEAVLQGGTEAWPQAGNPYGDGHATARIIAACEAFFQCGQEAG